MKHSILLLIFILTFSLFAEVVEDSESSSSSSNGSTLAFKKGSSQPGIGFNLDWNGFNPGVGALWDFGVFHNMFSMGGGAQVAFPADGISLVPEFRFAFHPFGLDVLNGKIPVASKLDPYVVATGGVKIVIGDGNSTDLSPRFGVALGVRYYFNNVLGVFAEGDWNNALVGLTFKLK
jgi:hypothetical protein